MNQHIAENKEFSPLMAIFTSLLCTAFGANVVAVKVSLSGLGSFTTAGLRFSIAIIAIFLWAKATRRSFDIKKGQMQQLLIISLIFTVQMSLLYLGMNKTSASRGTLLINLQPFFILLLANYFIPGERITKRKIVGLLMGFAGVAFVLLEKKDLTTGFQIGDLMILSTAFFWACQVVYVKRIIHAFEPFHIVLFQMIFSVPFFFLGGILWDSTMIAQVNPSVVVALLYQSLITASLGFIIWTNMLRSYGAVTLHSFVFIMPIAGVLLGGLLLGDPITFNILTALLLIVLGILVIHFNPRKAQRYTAS